MVDTTQTITETPPDPVIVALQLIVQFGTAFVHVLRILKEDFGNVYTTGTSATDESERLLE